MLWASGWGKIVKLFLDVGMGVRVERDARRDKIVRKGGVEKLRLLGMSMHSD
jgi:hypothetical protein